MTPQLNNRETGGYSNSARLKLYQALTRLDDNGVCYNRKSCEGWGINKKPISKWVYAYSANSMKEVGRWKVDLGGGNVQPFEPVIMAAIHQVVVYNASLFFANASPAQLKELTRIVYARKGHLSLYAFTDAMECLLQKEDPCAIDSYGFDAKAIMQACDLYHRKAKAEYYEWEKAGQVKQAHDLKPGDPVPAYVTELREKLESKFGVVYDEETSIEAMRAAAARYKAEQDFSEGF